MVAVRLAGPVAPGVQEKVQAKELPLETVTVLEQLIGSNLAPIGRVGGQSPADTPTTANPVKVYVMLTSSLFTLLGTTIENAAFDGTK